VRWLDRAAASRVISGLMNWKRQRQAKEMRA